MSHRNIAILIDGGFFLKRLPKLVNADGCDTVT
ncbi:MAG TPA: NYN domain-containing protein, partial [Marinobacter adhaerens]|nr:NYN domain-containing protein [Marinobacter adhaerens]